MEERSKEIMTKMKINSDNFTQDQYSYRNIEKMNNWIAPQ